MEKLGRGYFDDFYAAPFSNLDFEKAVGWSHTNKVQRYDKISWEQVLYAGSSLIKV